MRIFFVPVLHTVNRSAGKSCINSQHFKGSGKDLSYTIIIKIGIFTCEYHFEKLLLKHKLFTKMVVNIMIINNKADYTKFLGNGKKYGMITHK